MALRRYWPNWRAVPSAVLSAILPAKPSVTTTSTVPLPMSSPSTKPMIVEMREMAVAQNAAGLAHLPPSPLTSSTPILSRPTVGRSMSNSTRAMALPMAARLTRWVSSAPIEAPTSSTTDSPRKVGHSAAIAGRSMPSSIFRLKRDIAISAPVLPAETATSASPFLTASSASHIEDFQRPWRNAWLGLSSMRMATSVWMSLVGGLRRGSLVEQRVHHRAVAEQQEFAIGMAHERQLGARQRPRPRHGPRPWRQERCELYRAWSDLGRVIRSAGVLWWRSHTGEHSRSGEPDKPPLAGPGYQAVPAGPRRFFSASSAANGRSPASSTLGAANSAPALRG